MPHRPPVRNLYRRGSLPAVREKWRGAWRAARGAAKDPRGALRGAAPWLRESLRRDGRFFREVVAGAFAAVGRGLRHPRWRRALLGLAALAGFLVTFGWERCGLAGCPPVGRLAALQPGGAAVVLDADGDEIGDLSPVEWAVVDLDRLPEYVPEAFVAVEDQRFYRHAGVDWRRFAGAMLRNLRPGARAQGASTITMQLARNVFPERLPASDRSPRRKVLEIRVAREIERRLSKREILQLYLNHIYFGEGVYGIESAARVYFGKPARDLTLPEAALLAGLPKAPSSYNPRRSMERAVERRNLVLMLMERQGRIAPERAEEAREARVRLARWDPERRRRDRYGYYLDQVRREVEDALGEELYAGGLRIHTPLRTSVQRAAEEALEAQLRRAERGAFGRFRGPRRAEHEEGAAETAYLQGGAIAMEAATGDVVALVGGRSYRESRFDRVMRGYRQPGSAFKPIVYAAALADGVPLTERVVDEPLRRELPGGEVWEPRNFDGRFRGPVSVRQSFRWSVNTVAVRLAERAGLGEVADLSRDLGISAEVPRLPSVAIGAAALRPVELVAAYGAFANLGERVEPRFVTRVEDAEGATLWEAEVRRRDVLSPAVAFLVTALLRDVVDRGTGSAVRDAGLRGPAAGKTGTTNAATDAWFVGFTPEYVGAVWAGFDRPRPIAPEASGGALAAPVWARMMRAATRGRAAPTWEPPAGVVERRVVVATGEVIAPGCRARGETYEEYFLRRALPEQVCPRGEREEEGGVGAWLERRLTEAGEWLDEAWERAREAVGLGRRPAPPPPAERREPERAPAPAEAEEPAPPEAPEDTILLRGGPAPPPDTIVLPVPEIAEPEPRPVPAREPVPAPPEGPPDTVRISPPAAPVPAAPATPAP